MYDEGRSPRICLVHDGAMVHTGALMVRGLTPMAHTGALMVRGLTLALTLILTLTPIGAGVVEGELPSRVGRQRGEG